MSTNSAKASSKKKSQKSAKSEVEDASELRLREIARERHAAEGADSVVVPRDYVLAVGGGHSVDYCFLHYAGPIPDS